MRAERVINSVPDSPTRTDASPVDEHGPQRNGRSKVGHDSRRLKSGFMNTERKESLNVAGLSDSSDARTNGKGREPNRTTSALTDFIDEKQLLAKLPISRRTLGNWKAKGVLPYIKIGRRCLYDWASVQGALLRRQRGGQP